MVTDRFGNFFKLALKKKLRVERVTRLELAIRYLPSHYL